MTKIPPLLPVYPRCDFRPVRGEGAWLISEDGRKALDFAAGIAVNILGHGHPHLTQAIQKQAATLIHTSNLYGSPQGEEFAKRLIEGCFADTVFFTNSGAESLECAIKTARAYHQAAENTGHNSEKHELITFSNAFHGRTMATISASNQTKMHTGFAPLLAGFRYVEFNDLQAAEAAVTNKTAGFLVEPIQGEGGIRPASPAFLKGLRDLADKHDLLLIFDEVQCGIARTGALYAHQLPDYQVTPDIMALAKGIGGGFPLGACLASAKAARGMGIGAHGSTYGGNPLAMAAGQAVWDIVANEPFLAHVRAMGDRLRGAVTQLIGNYPALFRDVRGHGLMLGLQMTQESRPFVAHLRDKHGLLTVAAADNVVRLLPPLNIDESHIAICIEKLSAGAADYPHSNPSSDSSSSPSSNPPSDPHSATQSTSQAQQ